MTLSLLMMMLLLLLLLLMLLLLLLLPLLLLLLPLLLVSASDMRLQLRAVLLIARLCSDGRLLRCDCGPQWPRLRNGWIASFSTGTSSNARHELCRCASGSGQPRRSGGGGCYTGRRAW